MALGAAFLAKHHNAIVTSIPALQDIASMSILCSDKTGTLTTAKMSIIPDSIHAAEGFEKEDVLLFASLCSNPDKKDDPIDRATLQAFEKDEAGKKAMQLKELKNGRLVSRITILTSQRCYSYFNSIEYAHVSCCVFFLFF